SGAEEDRIVRRKTQASEPAVYLDLTFSEAAGGRGGAYARSAPLRFAGKQHRSSGERRQTTGGTAYTRRRSVASESFWGAGPGGVPDSEKYLRNVSHRRV